MSIRRLERNEWRAFCRHASRGYTGKHTRIEVLSLQSGSQLEAHHLPWIRMAYDPESDVFELVVGDVDHLVRRPRELYVDEGVSDVISLEIVDAEGARQIVTLRDPLMLPLRAD
jgi:hypothetical protein